MSLKVFTNTPSQKIGGIAHHVSSFTQYLEETKKNITMVGINLVSGDTEHMARTTNGRFTLQTSSLPIASIRDVIVEAQNLGDIKRAYEPVVAAYQKAIRRERPDLILINGTYYLPWSLFLAAREEKVPILLHYHGSLTKETTQWEERPRRLFRAMEQTFDDRRIHYVFPSILAKKTVEQEVFEHKIRQSTVLPNPVPLHFFQEKNTGRRENVGMVTRWAHVKHPQFSATLARYARRVGDTLRVNVITDLARDHREHQRLQELVHFRAPGNHEQLIRFYRSMGVVVSPSLFETYGNVAQEALATATPALINSNMGVAETFRELGLGDWIIDFTSVRNVYDRVKEVSGQSVPESARAYLREHYTPVAVFSRLWNILRNTA